ncbi:unnamed protein product [Amoebophrya sp. A120]|nr:unnamed protein product [Amoebophrya sp. A120]|eukprot:GSA120T00020371001.1
MMTRPPSYNQQLALARAPAPAPGVVQNARGRGFVVAATLLRLKLLCLAVLWHQLLYKNDERENNYGGLFRSICRVSQEDDTTTGADLRCGESSPDHEKNNIFNQHTTPGSTATSNIFVAAFKFSVKNRHEHRELRRTSEQREKLSSNARKIQLGQDRRKNRKAKAVGGTTDARKDKEVDASTGREWPVVHEDETTSRNVDHAVEVEAPKANKESDDVEDQLVVVDVGSTSAKMTGSGERVNVTMELRASTSGAPAVNISGEQEDESESSSSFLNIEVDERRNQRMGMLKIATEESSGARSKVAERGKKRAGTAATTASKIQSRLYFTSATARSRRTTTAPGIITNEADLCPPSSWEIHDNTNFQLSALCRIDLNKETSSEDVNATSVKIPEADYASAGFNSNGDASAMAQICVEAYEAANEIRGKLLAIQGKITTHGFASVTTDDKLTEEQDGYLRKYVTHVLDVEEQTNRINNENFLWMCKMICDLTPACVAFTYTAAAAAVPSGEEEQGGSSGGSAPEQNQNHSEFLCIPKIENPTSQAGLGTDVFSLQNKWTHTAKEQPVLHHYSGICKTRVTETTYDWRVGDCQDWMGKDKADYAFGDLCEINLSPGIVENATEMAGIAAENYNVNVMGVDGTMNEAEVSAAGQKCKAAVDWINVNLRGPLEDGSLAEDRIDFLKQFYTRAAALPLPKLQQDVASDESDEAPENLKVEFGWVCKMICDFLGDDCVMYSYGSQHYSMRHVNPEVPLPYHCWPKAANNKKGSIDEVDNGNGLFYSNVCATRAAKAACLKAEGAAVAGITPEVCEKVESGVITGVIARRVSDHYGFVNTETLKTGTNAITPDLRGISVAADAVQVRPMECGMECPNADTTAFCPEKCKPADENYMGGCCMWSNFTTVDPLGQFSGPQECEVLNFLTVWEKRTDYLVGSFLKEIGRKTLNGSITANDYYKSCVIMPVWLEDYMEANCSGTESCGNSTTGVCNEYCNPPATEAILQKPGYTWDESSGKVLDPEGIPADIGCCKKGENYTTTGATSEDDGNATTSTSVCSRAVGLRAEDISDPAFWKHECVYVTSETTTTTLQEDETGGTENILISCPDCSVHNRTQECETPCFEGASGGWETDPDSVPRFCNDHCLITEQPADNNYIGGCCKYEVTNSADSSGTVTITPEFGFSGPRRECLVLNKISNLPADNFLSKKYKTEITSSPTTFEPYHSCVAIPAWVQEPSCKGACGDKQGLCEDHCGTKHGGTAANDGKVAACCKKNDENAEELCAQAQAFPYADLITDATLYEYECVWVTEQDKHIIGNDDTPTTTIPGNITGQGQSGETLLDDGKNTTSEADEGTIAGVPSMLFYIICGGAVLLIVLIALIIYCLTCAGGEKDEEKKEPTSKASKINASGTAARGSAAEKKSMKKSEIRTSQGGEVDKAVKVDLGSHDFDHGSSHGAVDVHAYKKKGAEKLQSQDGHGHEGDGHAGDSGATQPGEEQGEVIISADTAHITSSQKTDATGASSIPAGSAASALSSVNTEASSKKGKSTKIKSDLSHATDVSDVSHDTSGGTSNVSSPTSTEKEQSDQTNKHSDGEAAKKKKKKKDAATSGEKKLKKKTTGEKKKTGATSSHKKKGTASKKKGAGAAPAPAGEGESTDTSFEEEAGDDEEENNLLMASRHGPQRSLHDRRQNIETVRPLENFAAGGIMSKKGSSGV